MKVMLLVHDALVPPEDAAEQFKKIPEDEDAEWEVEFHVLESLKRLGHDVQVVGVSESLTDLKQAVQSIKPKIVFNLLEEFHGEGSFDQHVVSVLELMKMPYTGAHPKALMLGRDKAIAKKIFYFHDIPTPKFCVYNLGKAFKKPVLKYPAIVKSLSEDASLGLSQASIVFTDDELEARVKYLQETFFTNVIVEEYIEGRELSVSLMGNQKLEAFPVWETYFEDLSKNAFNIQTRNAKFNESYRKRNKIVQRKADLAPTVELKVIQTAKAAFQALEMSGYARVDFRLSAENEPHIIEVNPNPDLSIYGELYNASKLVDWTYDDLIKKILSLGLQNSKERYKNFEDEVEKSS